MCAASQNRIKQLKNKCIDHSLSLSLSLSCSMTGGVTHKKHGFYTFYIDMAESKPWYLVNPKIAGKWMFIPLKMYL